MLIASRRIAYLEYISWRYGIVSVIDRKQSFGVILVLEMAFIVAITVSAGEHWLLYLAPTIQLSGAGRLISEIQNTKDISTLFKG